MGFTILPRSDIIFYGRENSFNESYVGYAKDYLRFIYVTNIIIHTYINMNGNERLKIDFHYLGHEYKDYYLTDFVCCAYQYEFGYSKVIGNFKFYPAFDACHLLLLFNSPNCRKISVLTAILSDNPSFLLCFGMVSHSLALLIFNVFLTVFVDVNGNIFAHISKNITIYIDTNLHFCR